MDESIFEEKNNLTVASFCVKYVCHVSFRRTLKGTLHNPDPLQSLSSVGGLYPRSEQYFLRMFALNN